MKAKIISQSKLPDIYEEWCRDFIENTIEPFNREIISKPNTPETRDYVMGKALLMYKAIEDMKPHYD